MCEDCADELTATASLLLRCMIDGPDYPLSVVSKLDPDVRAMFLVEAVGALRRVSDNGREKVLAIVVDPGDQATMDRGDLLRIMMESPTRDVAEDAVDAALLIDGVEMIHMCTAAVLAALHQIANEEG